MEGDVIGEDLRRRINPSGVAQHEPEQSNPEPLDLSGINTGKVTEFGSEIEPVIVPVQGIRG